MSKSNFRNSLGARQDWKKHAAFSTATATILRAHRPTTWHVPDPDLPVSRRPVCVAAVGAVTLLDTGNVSKSVLDCAQGVLFHNDAEIRTVHEFTVRSRTHQSFALAFAQLPPGASMRESAAATYRLVTTLLDQPWNATDGEIPEVS